MSKLTQKDYEKELEAQKKRVEALKYLNENGCGPTQFETSLSTKSVSEAMEEKSKTKKFTTDNTLEQIRKQNISLTSSSSTTSSTTSLSLKNILIDQQTSIHREYVSTNAPLPPNWEAVTDPTSGNTYYWNRATDVTTWERPIDRTINTINGNEDDLPPGWVKVIHSATKQEYYIHQATNEKRWTKPTNSQDQSDIPQAITSRNVTNTTTQTQEKKKPRETESQQQEKRRRLHIDPLDPTGGMGNWTYGATADGKMADSTASGPLWQQRPYPAPGQALKSKEKKSGQEAGPSLPSQR